MGHFPMPPHLREQFDLDEADMAALLLATVPALGFDLYETLAQIGRFSFGLMSVSPEMVAMFTDMDMAGRVRLHDQLRDTADTPDDLRLELWPIVEHMP